MRQLFLLIVMGLFCSNILLAQDIGQSVNFEPIEPIEYVAPQPEIPAAKPTQNLQIDATTPSVSISERKIATPSTTSTPSVTPTASGQKKISARVLSIENEFIKIIVNDSNDDTGRFAIETVSGNPSITADDHQPLIYGRPIPWTSYTTLRINGNDHIFGGSSKKLSKRLNTPVVFGTILSQNVSGNSIHTTVRFEGDIDVTQSLSFVRNPATNVKDTALVAYRIKNNGTSTASIGLRVMMDTKLGNNDGAPFRIGEKAVTSEVKLKFDKLYDYFQAFDSFVTPSVVAQGGIRHPDYRVNMPDTVYLVNWGTLFTHPWVFSHKPGRPFVREGETENDTALAYYWLPVDIAPGAELEYRSLYGLGGVSLSPGDLSLGIAAPAERYANNSEPFLLMAYIVNSGGFDSKNTIVDFSFPPGVDVVKGKLTHNLGTFKAGETKQIPLQVSFNNPKPGTSQLSINVSSDTLASNSIYRPINILAPPSLAASIHFSAPSVNSQNPYVTAELMIRNPNTHSIEDIGARILLDASTTLASVELEKKTIKEIKPGDVKTLRWLIETTSFDAEPIPVTFRIASPLTGTQQLSDTYVAKVQTPESYIELSDSSVKTNDVVYAEIGTRHFPAINNASLTVEYDPNKLQFVRYSSGSDFLEDASPFSIRRSAGKIHLSRISANASQHLQIAKCHFKALQSGETSLYLIDSENRRHVIKLSVTN